MDITLYVSRSDDAYAQMEHVLEQLGIPYALHFKDEDPDIESWLGVPHLPVLVVDGRCTFFSPDVTTEEFKVLIQSCLVAEDIEHRSGQRGPKNARTQNPI